MQNMRRIITLAATFAAMALGVTASAQIDTTVDYYPYGCTIRGGVSLPIDSSLQNIGKTLLGLGIDYRFKEPLLGGGETYLALDYFGTGITSAKGYVFPITLNHRFYTGKRGEGRRTYAFIGAGVSYIEYQDNATALTLRGGFGAELSDNIIFETAAYLSDKAAGTKVNSVAFYVGYRF